MDDCYSDRVGSDRYPDWGYGVISFSAQMSSWCYGSNCFDWYLPNTMPIGNDSIPFMLRACHPIC